MIDVATLSFLDGYLYRVMIEMLRSEGTKESGLYEFYQARIEQERHALSGYDRILVDYLLTNFDAGKHRVVHAGIGVGTLTCALAVAGFRIAGLERDRGRTIAASRVRSAVLERWPAVEERYQLMPASFPEAVIGTDWIGDRTVLVFTNCGSDWPEELVDSIIDLFPGVGGAILDARLFGKIRNSEEERQALVARIQGRGLAAKPLPETNRLGAYYFHFQRQAGE
jgi:hypothetical protein